MRYYYADSNNQPTGPCSIEELRQLHIGGTLKANTWVVEEGGSHWRPYSDLAAGGAEAGPAVLPAAGVPANDKAAGPGAAILWFLCCLPIGFMQWGQTVKGWVWAIAALVTGGLAGIPAIVDYWMNYSVQKKRKVGEWEFFPTK